MSRPGKWRSWRAGCRYTGEPASQVTVVQCLPPAHLALSGYCVVRVLRCVHQGILDAGHHFAFVEQIEGPNFEKFAATAPPPTRAALLEQIGAQLRRLHATERDYSGTLLDGASRDGASIDAQQPVDVWLGRALVELEAAAETHEIVGSNKERIRQRLQDLKAPIEPRTDYRLIHGELDPGHVLVRQSDQVMYFVDLEGLQFTDVEVAHAFLKLRYSAGDYLYLAQDDLDPARMAFFTFALYGSLVYAGSRFMLKGFHDQAFAQRLFTRNLARVLDSL